MAYFAQLDDNNIVTQVVSISNDVVPDPAPNDQVGEAFLHSLGFTGRWIQTSFNSRIRKNPAGIGWTYDPNRDAFIEPKPSEGNWVLNEETCQWEKVVA